MVAGNGRSYPFRAPTVFRFIDSTKACFILKHQTNSAVKTILVDIICQL